MIFIGIISVIFFWGALSFAATLSLPSQGHFLVGRIFTLPIYVSAKSGESLNAVSGTLTYPIDKLQVISIDKSGIINFWTQEPTFSNIDGSVRFEGVSYNPGFSGTNGRVLGVTFKAIAAGTGSLSFSSASVLANDGKGTNILNSADGTTILLSSSGTNEMVSPSASISDDLRRTEITSSTHPDSTKWYNTSLVEIDWTNQPDAVAIRIGYDKNSSGLPTVIYDYLISHKELTLKDGVWYFHLQEKIGSSWGAVTNFRIQIDTKPPLPMDLKFPHGATTTDPRPVALFNTRDELSGIDHYTILVDGYGLVEISKDQVGSNPYVLPAQDPGKGLLKVIAYDQAGNSVSAEGDFEVIGLDLPKLDPVEDITAGDILQISGLMSPNARIDAFLRGEDEKISSQWTRSSANGAFRVIWKKQLPPGIYSIAVQATDERGAKSALSPEINFQIREPIFFTIGSLAINYLSLLIIISAVVGSLLFMGWYLWQRFHAFRKGILDRLGQTHHALHQQLGELREGVLAEVAALEKIKSRRKLTEEEERLIYRLKKMFDKAERNIGKDIDSTIKAQ